MNNCIIIVVIIGLILILLIRYYRKELSSLLKKLFNYLTNQILTLLFNKKDSEIINVALNHSSSNLKYWVVNNIITPLIILYLPFLFTMVSEDFNINLVSKSWQQLTLTGTFTMIGINVMRANFTSVNEILTNDSFQNDPGFKELFAHTETLKSKLRSWVHILTILSSFFYFIQVGAFINADDQKSYKYMVIFGIVFFFSVFIARILSVIQSNFTKDEEITRGLIEIMNLQRKASYNNLKNEISKGGIIE